MIQPDQLSNPSVRDLVKALNAGDRQAFLAVLTPDATLSDDGSDRDLRQWIDREIFDSAGHLDVEAEKEGGLALKARFRNQTWGEMSTAWRFRLDGDRIGHIETGQA